MSSRPHILVVDDDTEIRAMLRRRLLADNFHVDTARNGAEGVALAQQRRPDVVIMDLSMPEQDGISAVQELRDAGLWVPVLMLTAHADVEQRLDSFRAGVDDFLAKPFHYQELALRLQALMRRGAGIEQPSDDARARYGDLIIDRAQRRCTRGDSVIELSPREFDLLSYLAAHAGVALHRDAIEDAVWAEGASGASNVVDVYVGYLRRKLEADGSPRVIHTVRGHGFMFTAEDPS